GYDGCGQRYETVSYRHIRMHTVGGRDEHCSDVAEQQAYGEGEKRADEGYKSDPHRDGIPAGWARRAHGSRLHREPTCRRLGGREILQIDLCTTPGIDGLHRAIAVSLGQRR